MAMDLSSFIDDWLFDYIRAILYGCPFSLWQWIYPMLLMIGCLMI